MMNSQLQEYIDMFADEETVILDGFYECILGIDTKQRLIYDAEKIIKTLMDDNDWNRADSTEWFYFNIEGAYMGEHTPVFIYSFDTELST